MNGIVTREQARDMQAAHAEGLHDELPREFCPDCDGRELNSYPTAASIPAARTDLTGPTRQDTPGPTAPARTDRPPRT